MNSATTASDRIWNAIDSEKKRDRLIKRISVLAWSVTLVLVMLLAAVVGMQIYQMARGAMLGVVPWLSVAGAAMPLILTLGILSVLIGVISTVALFFRLRAASLSEIQLRLAALEDMLASEGRQDNARSGTP